MIHLIILLLSACLLAANTPAHTADTIGLSFFSVPVPGRGGVMDITLWYPATAGGTPVLVGDSPLFKGEAAQQGAPAATGSHPLILLSHGGLKSGPFIGAWMASRLVSKGFVVAMMRQPDPQTMTSEESLHEIWLRPADLSAALTAIEKDSTLPVKIDRNRIGVLGFLVGGTSALSIAGGRLDPENFARSCEPDGTGVDCAEFASAGIDLHSIDRQKLTRSHLDPRVKAAVVIDPEFGASFAPESLTRISIPVRLINLGSRETIWPGLRASGLKDAIPNARYDLLTDASQYSAFSECKPSGAAILRKEGEEPLCDDPKETSRTAIHDRLAEIVAAAFSTNLPQ
ncbi:putative dienelactone hydrolase [Rhizobium sp. BK275]|uniref:alpha/beta hydrolase family protein n=1 Tax=Rhizobium sp. BK275 TaxID=2587077 RepID=UPI0016219361|nr:dienelactone hydrolase [Rhizobium sp. BK275]MBB3392168.1 putative dienelactone hydrolase [Rhizobium sp. BK275]